MIEKLILSCIALFCLVAVGITPVNAVDPIVSSAPLPDTPFQTFDDDPAIFNDCNYCHGLHGSRRDVAALLNYHQERYQQYLEPPASLDATGAEAVFDWESSHKCPRSRVKNGQ